MDDSYQNFCARNARRFAEMRELEEEAAQSTATPRQRSGADQLIYKTHDDALVTPSPSKPAQDWSAWNDWADSRIAKFLDENPFTDKHLEPRSQHRDENPEWRNQSAEG